ncbi:hypothetical protein [Pseudonocardia sp. H11422]|uniref:hypothetical protein n=1 Tax=Pseudonocardia sp. H11422 TaxID=2835866 RepID=UPI001BDC5C37|nr:hypothetical protein [Pseudonocardia sp. H11422]
MDTTAPAPPAPPESPARLRRPRVSLWLLRSLVTVHLLAVLAQPLLAGLFLAGDVDAIGVHAAIGSLLAALSLVVIGATLVYTLAGRGRPWVLPVAVVIFLAEGLQIGMGFARTLQVHVPLGVTIVVAAVLLAVWVWSPAAGRAR